MPTAKSVAVAPDTVQTAGVRVAKLTSRPDEAVAVKASGEAFNA
jgi:hypothetical protein